MTESTITATDCTLTAKAVLLNDSKLAIYYELTNESESPVYLFNKLGKIGATSVLNTDPNTANVVLGPNRVTVGKALVPVPDDMEVEKHYVPGLTRVAPGETFSEELLLPFPLVPFTWYRSRPMKRTPVQRPLYLELGYTLAVAGANELVKPLDTDYGKLYYADWFPVEGQLLISTGPLLPSVSVFSEK